MEWFSVKDKLPEKDIPIIIVSDEKAMHGIYSSDWRQCNFYTTNFEQYIFVDDVTHWMPLPEPPK